MNAQKNAPVLNSRKMRMKKNPIAWIVLLVIAVAIWGSMLIPKFSEWQEKRNEIKSLELMTQSLRQSTELKSLELEKKEAEFELVAGPYLVKEKQWFSKTIDTSKIVKILELYTLQLENLDSKYKDSKFELTKVLLGKTERVEKKPYSSTDLSLNFETDDENLREFLNFLQTGELSERIQAGKENGQIELVDYKFLENNVLPLIHIDSIQRSANPDQGTILVGLKAILFSQ